MRPMPIIMGAGLLGLQLAGDLSSESLDKGWKFLMGEGVDNGWAFKEEETGWINSIVFKPATNPETATSGLVSPSRRRKL